MNGGPHVFRKLRDGKPCVWFVYAWRGGPQVWRQEGGTKPETRKGKIADLIAAARADFRIGPEATIAGLIGDYRRSPEWGKLSESTKPTWLLWLDRIKEQFGDAPVDAFDDRSMRRDVLEWRDRWSHQPRSADMAIQVLSRLLSWGVDRTRLSTNIATGISQLYEVDRSDIIWEQHHFDAFLPHASAEVQEAVELAACTGLRRGDLIKVPLSAVGDHAIIWQTGKSRGRNRIVIPLLPETKAVIRRINERFEANMAKRVPSKRYRRPDTILFNSWWRPWTASGFGGRFNDAKVASGIEVNLHDLRGTFATRCMIAGLTDQEIADILGWSTKDVALIRAKYVDQARVVVAIGERIARSTVNGM